MFVDSLHLEVRLLRFEYVCKGVKQVSSALILFLHARCLFGDLWSSSPNSTLVSSMYETKFFITYKIMMKRLFLELKGSSLCERFIPRVALDISFPLHQKPHTTESKTDPQFNCIRPHPHHLNPLAFSNSAFLAALSRFRCSISSFCVALCDLRSSALVCCFATFTVRMHWWIWMS